MSDLVEGIWDGPNTPDKEVKQRVENILIGKTITAIRWADDGYHKTAINEVVVEGDIIIEFLGTGDVASICSIKREEKKDE